METPMNNIDYVIDPNIEKSELIKKELAKSFSRYQKILSVMSMDAPISILNLPKSIEKILINNGFLRLYEILDVDFSKIEGLDDRSRNRLATLLDQFISML